MRYGALPFLLIGLSGCWPRIPGAWSDYDVPEETQIVGALNYFEPLGGYWGDSEPSGNVAWGWLDTPQIGLHAFEFQPGCRRVDPDDPGPSLEFVDVGASESRIRSELGSVDIPFNESASLFYGDTITEDDVGAGVSWTLDNVDGDEGLFFVSRFLVMPPRLDFSGFTLDGDAPDNVDRQDFTVTWSPEPGADYVTAQFQLERSQTIVETAVCYAEMRDGTLFLPASTWEDLDSADGLYVYLGAQSETESKIEGVYGGSRMAAAWFQIGYVRFQ